MNAIRDDKKLERESLVKIISWVVKRNLPEMRGEIGAFTRVSGQVLKVLKERPRFIESLSAAADQSGTKWRETNRSETNGTAP